MRHTAEEVREHAKRMRDAWEGHAADMLLAYADMLEQMESADAEDAARWRYLLRNRFVLAYGTCLIDAHRTAQDAELLDAIDEARAQEGK